MGIVDAENGQGLADDVQIGGGLGGVALAVLKIVVPGIVVGGADPGEREGMAGGPEKIDMSADGVEGQPDEGVVQIEQAEADGLERAGRGRASSAPPAQRVRRALPTARSQCDHARLTGR